MPGDLLDLVLLAGAVVFAVSGARQGLIVGALSFAGFLGGAVSGAAAAPLVQRVLPGHPSPTLVGLLVVFAVATLGQVGTVAAAGAVRDRLRRPVARRADAVGGAAVSVLSMLLVAWLLGTALAHSSLRLLSRQVNHSAVLTGIDAVMPDGVRTWFSSFRQMLASTGFPPVFGALGPEQIVPVAPPDPASTGAAGVRRAAPDVVKVTGDASCDRRLEGSGFLYAPEHVLTNAHVVAGVRDVQVTLDDGLTVLTGHVVLYDPHRDVAVLYVPSLVRPALRLGGPVTRGAVAVVAGYPQDGPLTVAAARVRGVQLARGPDIYQRSVVTREIYSVRSRVLPGNSGGPLLAPDGSVLGIVFAAASDDQDTGYVLTSAEVRSDAASGAQATLDVTTGGCD